MGTFTANSIIFVNNGVEKMRIKNDGNVGIGNTNPGYKIDVSGDVNCSGIYRVNGVDVLATKINTTDQYKLFNNMGVNHESYTDFNLPPNFGFWFIQGTGNSPATNGATQYYCINQGLGNNYSWTGANSYRLQIGIPRNVSNPYISIRYKENNVMGGWNKISAGQADKLTTAITINGVSFDGTANITIPSVEKTTFDIGSLLGGNSTNLNASTVFASTSGAGVYSYYIRATTTDQVFASGHSTLFADKNFCKVQQDTANGMTTFNTGDNKFYLKNDTGTNYSFTMYLTKLN